MCGISGFALKEPYQPTDISVLRKMTDIMRHRGPDGEGFHIEPGAGIGFRRLSIIDLKSGDQPLPNETGTLHLVCNGEIYNYIELRKTLISKGHAFKSKSDAEVIVHLYEEYGPECLNHLRGMFAFALWDAEEQQLFLARDRLGIKPLYYAVSETGSLYFASEQKATLAANAVRRDVSARAFEDLFTFGFILSPKTLFENIHMLEPGHFLLFKHGEYAVKQYWDLSFPPNHQRPHMSENDWAKKLHEKLKEVISLHLRSDVPVGAWLSAGIDSSSVVCLMDSLSRTPVHTFSLTFADYPHFDEMTTQKVLDQFPGYGFTNERIAIKEKHFDLILKGMWHLENPTSSANHVIQMELARVSAKNFKVVLTGEGADEIFGGYPWYLFNTLFRPFAVFPGAIRKLIFDITGNSVKRPWTGSVFNAPYPMDLNRYARLLGSFGIDGIIDKLFTDRWHMSIARSPNNYANLSNSGQSKRWQDFEKIQYMETKTRLPNYIIRGLDKASMAHSLEARVPFLDHELVELCTQIPPSLKLKYFKEKYIFRKAMAADLPREINKRKKRGLIAPGGPWLRGKLPEFVRYLLSEPQLRKKGYFDPAFVSRILNRHRSGRHDCARTLMLVLNIQIWDELFVSGCRPE